MFRIEDFRIDEVFGERLLIHKHADQSELNENIRVARVLLNCFVDINIRINEHLLVFGHKNLEYTINEKLGDWKGIYGRHEDFTSGSINECYVVHNSKAVVVKTDVFTVFDKDTIKQRIENEIEKLRT